MSTESAAVLVVLEKAKDSMGGGGFGLRLRTRDGLKESVWGVHSSSDSSINFLSLFIFSARRRERGRERELGK